MIDQIAVALKPLYVYIACGALLLLLTLAVLRSRRRGFNEAWAPLLPVIQGSVKSRGTRSTMTGSYHDHPVTASMWRGGADMPATFAVQIPVAPGGRDWAITHGSEKMLGPQAWRPFTKDPALQARLEASKVVEPLQGFPDDMVVQYDGRQGMLSVEEQIEAPSVDHFKALLKLLEWLADVNRQLNG
jgi:hypothetical protein